MNDIPEDLKKVHQKTEQLQRQKGQDFANGFQTYMVFVDFEKKDPDETLYGFLLMLNASRLDPPSYVESILTGEVESDDLKGFEYGKQYSQEVNYTYGK